MKPPSSSSSIEMQVASQFPELEKLIETENFDQLNQSLGGAYEELEKITKEKGGLGKAKDARKAMKAIERVMDLLRELLKLKYQMASGGELKPQGKK